MPFDLPGGDVPLLPDPLREKIEQLQRLRREIELELIGLGAKPVDDTPQVPMPRRPIPHDEIQEIIDALNRRLDPFRQRSGIRISGVEMTQSVQYYDLHGQGSGVDSDNSVPLVAGKDLILRAYVEQRPGSIFGWPAQFHGTVTYRGKQVQAMNGPQPLQAATALRRRLINDSLNFRIPAADCHGNPTFTIRVYEWSRFSQYLDPKTAPVSPHHASYTIPARFRDVPRMKITGVLLGLKQQIIYIAPPSGPDLVKTMARFLPMLPTAGFDYYPCVRQDVESGIGSKAAWDILINVVANLRSASTERAFYVGLVDDATLGSIPISARGIGRPGVALSFKDDTRALSHELGHACSQDHVNVNSPPAPLDAKYPTYGTFPFGSVGETGIDTARLALYDPATAFDYMTYNENGAKVAFTTSTWISPYNYMRMMRTLEGTEGTGDIILVAIIVGAVVGMNFRVHRDGRVEVLPSYRLTGVPLTHDARERSDIIMDVYDRAGALIDTYRCHRHNPYQDPDGAYVDYHEVVPWPDDVGHVVFARGREELARVDIGESSPTVELREIRRSHRDGADLAHLEWTASVGQEPDRTTPPIAALVRYSHDAGRTWRAVAANVRDTSMLLDLDQLPGGEECRVELVVSSGLSCAVVQSDPFTVRRKPRRAHIASPLDGQTFQAGAPIVFAGGSYSPDFGTSAPDEVTWRSERECCLVGTGTHFVRDDLAAGIHRLTISTGDGVGGQTSASVVITVQNAPADARE